MNTDIATHQIREMTVHGIHHLVERAYREGHELQYLREMLVNSLEAGATRVEFGPDWHGVEHEGVYRLQVSDDGRGMTPAELNRFLMTYGGGGKPIGGEHENFGVGAKTSLLPWNHEGVVVVSWTEECPDGAMMWLAQDSRTGEYGARMLEDHDGSWDIVVRPMGRWAAVRPAWLTRTGTVIVCLGDTGTEDTFLGKHVEGDLRMVASYLNRRVWEIPAGTEVAVQELRSHQRDHWPRSLAEASAGGPGPDGVDRRWNRRVVRGAKFFVAGVSSSKGSLSGSGTVPLSDGTEIDWYLWEGDRPAVHSYAQETGYVAAAYHNELYDFSSHGVRARSFGVTAAEVRRNLTLIARPPAFDATSGYGVYPDTARNALKIQAQGKRAGEPLPWEEWAEEFARKLPDPVVEALAKAGPARTGTVQGGDWQRRLYDRFGALWRTLRYVPTGRRGGHLRAVPDQGVGATGAPGGSGAGPGETAAEPGGREAPEGLSGPEPGATGDQRSDPTLSAAATERGQNARAVKTKGGLPAYEWATMQDTDEDGVYPVAWYRETKDHPNGVVQIARDWKMFVELRRYWRSQYPDHLGEEVDRVVEETYGEAMVARIAHSESLVNDPRWGKPRVEELRGQTALTASLLGLLSEDTAIAQRLGRLGVRRRAVST